MLDEVSPHVLIVDDHPLFCEGLTHAIIKANPQAKISIATNLRDAQRAIDSGVGFTLVVLDLTLPNRRATEAVEIVRRSYPPPPILALAETGDCNAAQIAREHDLAFLFKSATMGEVVRAIRKALPEHVRAPAISLGRADPAEPLTPAQRRVLLGLMRGGLNKQIAHEMQISEATVKAHVTAVFRKLGVKNRTQAVIAARTLGLDVCEVG